MRFFSKSENVSVIFFYIITFVLVTFPLVLYFPSKMPGNSGDEYLMSWFFWEFEHYVFVLHKWPFFTNLAYYPHGVPLYVSTSMPVNSLIASAAYYFSKNLILAYNLIFFASFILNAYFAYLLADETVKNKTASFFAGAIFAGSPILIEQARWGDINIWSAYGLPLYILFFNRLYKNPNLKNALFAASGLFLATYAGFYEFTVMLALYSIFFILYQFFKEDKLLRLGKNEPALNENNKKPAELDLRAVIKNFKNRFPENPVFNAKYLKNLAVMLFSFIAIASPLLGPAIYYAYIDKRILFFNPDMFSIKAYSATLFAFFFPPFFNHFLLPFTTAVYFNPVYPFMVRGANSLDFLGYVPLVFFAIAVIKGFKNVSFYFYAFLFFVLMSLSPLIHIVNNIRVFDPFVYLIDILPVFKGIEESGRYMIMGYLFFSVVCAYGIKIFFERNLFKGRAVKFLLIVLIFFGIIIGYSSYPFQMGSVKVSKGIYILKNSEPYGAVLTIPFLQDGFKMYEQTIYQKPMLAGFIIRYGFHNLYKKYLPKEFFIFNGKYYKGNNLNQRAVIKLGNPRRLAENFKYFKKLNVRYLLIVKSQLGQIYGKTDSLNLKKINGFLKDERGKAVAIYDSKRTMVIKLKY